MIKERSFGEFLLFSILTCGIYYYVWLYGMHRDINVMANDSMDATPGEAVFYTILTCGIYDYFWFYKQGNKMQHIGRARGIYMSDDGGTYILFKILGVVLSCGILNWIATYKFIENFNVLANAYNKDVQYFYNPENGPYNI